ncbi:MAG TPA: PSD1 and planctomycete cytochrome C domain-containing protein [Pirellulales bacterium]
MALARRVLAPAVVGWPLLAVIAAAWLFVGAGHAASRAPERLSKDKVDFFEQKIRPVLTHKCYSCHSGDAAKAKGHLLLDTRAGLRKGGDSGPVVVPGRPHESLLVEAIRYEELEMPPDGKLPDEVIENFVRWVEMGAPDPRAGKAAKPRNKIDLAEARKYWAFQPPQAWPAPVVQNTAWPRTDIDRFVLAHLEQEKLRPVGDADPVTLVRRVTFDLTGLPPTPAEIDAFVADRSSTALATVVNRLLASPQFGERWGRHWLDVVRYAESTGKERNIPYRYAWRYRDYVIAAFNSGKPYSRFIVEQLAGDLLPAKDAADKDRLLIATGFLAIGPKGVAATKPEQFRMDQVDDQIDVMSRAFMGLTVACARCHDHKFDPIPTTDYYALAGVFHSTNTFSGVAPGTKYADENRLLKLTDPAARSQVSAKEVEQEQARQNEIAGVQAQLATLRKQTKAASPKASSFGKGKRRKRPSPTAPTVDRKQARAKIKRLEDKLEELHAAPSPYTDFVMGVAESPSPANCSVLNRGELTNKGPEVPRGVLTVLKTVQGSHIPPRQSGRLQVARWIASSDNPLTARVMVNRVWEHLLGHGLVETVDNFGALGEEPSHPELLDTLAVRFMEEKWSIKHLIRSIVLSRVYQLASDHDATNYQRDAGNRLLWRMERRRLDAEEIRDAMLMASGELDLTRPSGSAVMDLKNKQLFGARGLTDAQFAAVRSVYLPIVRNLLPDALQVFDMADPNLIVGRRDVTNVPTQALYLLNNPFVLHQAEVLAKRVLAQEGLDPAGRVDFAYRLCLGRLPTEIERVSVLRYLHAYRQSLEAAGHRAPHLAAWTSFCQTLFAVGQFRYLY